MKRFMVVRGRRGLLCGDPRNPRRFIAQRKKSWGPGEMPKAMHARYEPTEAALPYSRELIRLINKSMLEKLWEGEAKNAEEALAKAKASSPSPAPPPPPPPVDITFEEESD